MKRFLTGFATGLAIGYLTAPRSGKESRHQLTQTTNQQTIRLKAQWVKAMAGANRLLDQVRASLKAAPVEPNLFADMESGKLDRYLDEAARVRRKAKERYNEQRAALAAGTSLGVGNAEEAPQR